VFCNGLINDFYLTRTAAKLSYQGGGKEEKAR